MAVASFSNPDEVSYQLGDGRVATDLMPVSFFARADEVQEVLPDVRWYAEIAEYGADVVDVEAAFAGLHPADLALGPAERERDLLAAQPSLDTPRT